MTGARAVFLAGPPGVGKSTFGRSACDALGITFLDLGSVCDASERPANWRETIDQIVAEQSIGVIELPWTWQLSDGTFRACRQLGELLALWAHPQDMQQRSGQAEPLFRKGRKGLSVNDGFGARGTSCPEYRLLDRACPSMLKLVRCPLDKAHAAVRNAIEKLIRCGSSTEVVDTYGVLRWSEYWRCEYSHVPPDVIEVILQATARYIDHLVRDGASPRTIKGVCSDLQAMGMTNLGYGDFKELKSAQAILDSLTVHANTFERKFCDSYAAVERYRKNCECFLRFISQESGIRA